MLPAALAPCGPHPPPHGEGAPDGEIDQIDGVVEQIDGCNMLGLALSANAGGAGLRLRFAQRSGEVVNHARQCPIQRRQAQNIENLSLLAARAKSDLTLVTGSLPCAAQLVGLPPWRRVLRKDNATPRDFAGLSLAVFMGARQRCGNAGVKRKRLVLFTSDFILARQQNGLQNLLANAKLWTAARRPELDADGCCVLVYTHEWDETRSFFKKVADMKYQCRDGRQGIHVQTMVQRVR